MIKSTQVFRHNRPCSVWTCLCVCYMDYILTARQLRASIRIMHNCNKWYIDSRLRSAVYASTYFRKHSSWTSLSAPLSLYLLLYDNIILMQHCLYLFIYLFTVYLMKLSLVPVMQHGMTWRLALKKKSVCFIRTQSAPRSKHSPPRLYRTNPLMLYKEKVAVCSKNHTQHINPMWVPFWMLNPVVRKVTTRL